MKGDSGFIVVAPVYNEEKVVDLFLHHMVSIAANCPLKGIVIVDDGSTDQTVERIGEFAKKCIVPIRLVRLSRNFGHQNAVIAGLSSALAWCEDERIEFIGLLDADLQDKPEDFFQLWQHHEKADVIYAVRSSESTSWITKFLSNQFHRLLSIASNVQIPRNTGTFSLIRINVVRVILATATKDPYFPGLRASAGFRQIGIPLERDIRQAGTSRVGFMGLIRLASRAFFAYSELPQKLMVILAVGIFSLSFVMCCVLVIIKFAGLVHVEGVTTVLAVIFVSLGVQSIYSSIIVILVSRSMSSMHNKPFIIMSEEIFHKKSKEA
jgi:polyisoprenyl-phosphate glycosyltransferase